MISVPPSGRRALGRRLVCQSGVLAGLCCLPGLRAYAETLTGAALALREIAPGVLVSHGEQAEASAANLGAIANTSVVIGAAGVAVIDTGGCRLWGERLREAIAARTKLPVIAVIMTHMHPDHVFGAAAFADAPRIIGHHNLPGSLAQRASYYQRGFNEALGPLAQGTHVVMPNELVTTGAVVDLGGRRLSLAAHATAHTDNDLSVIDDASGLLWTGDLLFVERIPALDGSLPGWIAVLQAMGAPGADRCAIPGRAIPGHGPVAVGWPDASQPMLRYLTTLRDGTRAVLRRGGTIEQAVASVGQGERGRWLLFDDYHARNVTTAYAELEWE